MTQITSLPGLGPKSANMLAGIGVHEKSDLQTIGSELAFIAVCNRIRYQPRLNLLYVMAGALENRNWLDVAREGRLSLLIALEDIELLYELIEEYK